MASKLGQTPPSDATPIPIILRIKSVAYTKGSLHFHPAHHGPPSNAVENRDGERDCECVRREERKNLMSRDRINVLGLARCDVHDGPCPNMVALSCERARG